MRPTYIPTHLWDCIHMIYQLLVGENCNFTSWRPTLAPCSPIESGFFFRGSPQYVQWVDICLLVLRAPPMRARTRSAANLDLSVCVCRMIVNNDGGWCQVCQDQHCLVQWSMMQSVTRPELSISWTHPAMNHLETLFYRPHSPWQTRDNY